MTDTVAQALEKQSVDLVSAAFVKACGEMPTVKFDSANPFFKSKYASLAAIISETRPILLKHGLAIHQVALIKDGNVTVSTSLRHTTGQLLDFGSLTMPIGDTGKSEVQAAGSLITYLKRYSWQTALGIAADEDDDGNSAPTKQQTQKPAKLEPVEKEYRTPTTHATEKTRMWALNQLKACAGQPNRDTVTGFLRSRGWVDGLMGEPETWRLDKVPVTVPQASALNAEVMNWDLEQHAITSE